MLNALPEAPANGLPADIDSVRENLDDEQLNVHNKAVIDLPHSPAILPMTGMQRPLLRILGNIC